MVNLSCLRQVFAGQRTVKNEKTNFPLSVSLVSNRGVSSPWECPGDDDVVEVGAPRSCVTVGLKQKKAQEFLLELL